MICGNVPGSLFGNDLQSNFVSALCAPELKGAHQRALMGTSRGGELKAALPLRPPPLGRLSEGTKCFPGLSCRVVESSSGDSFQITRVPRRPE